MNEVYVENAGIYAQAGWPCILPVPLKKSPPPEGFTGAQGADTDPAQILAFAQAHPDYSIALRLPDGVLGIDVDHYRKGGLDKRGDDTLRSYLEQWGPLPATWASTARGDENGTGPSRIMFFRVPVGRYATKLGADIDIIQRHHRYVVVGPSVHPDGGTYRWYGPDGRPAQRVPTPGEFPELPAAWVAGLAEGASAAGVASADVASGWSLLSAIEADDRTPCVGFAYALDIALKQLAEVESGSRHDTATERTHALVHLGAQGHPGGGLAISALRARWRELTSGEDRDDEFERMLLTSARKAVTVHGYVPSTADPCFTIGGLTFHPPAPGTYDPEAAPAPAPIGIVQIISPYDYIGTEVFEPPVNTDQELAEHVLGRVYPMLRYATDANTWLRRGPECWETTSDLAAWAVSQVARVMPFGDSGADKDTDEFRRAQRRQRFLANSGGNAIAGKMRAVVAAMHPSTLRLDQLDAQPTILWAGGLPWDLRRSADVPSVADLDPATPHLRAAGVHPQLVPTPLWDAYLAAVWPDKEIRAWALRVLSIAVTGYADAALPILLGETRRGKSQLVNLVMSVMGSYAHAADPRLLGGVDRSHADIVYDLKGRRLSFIDEGPRDGRLGQERLKQLTGGAALTANEKYKGPVTFYPTHTLVLTTNDEPSLTDPAVRARARLIPCAGDPDAVRVAREAIGETSDRAWRAEAPGVLAQLIREAARWLADRSSGTTAAAPVSIRYAGEELAAEQDPVRGWLEYRCEPDETGSPSMELFQDFRRFCRDIGILDSKIPTLSAWGRALTKLGYAVSKKGTKSRPLRLRNMWGASVDPSRTVGGLLGAEVSNPDSPSSDPSSSPLSGHLDTYNRSIAGEKTEKIKKVENSESSDTTPLSVRENTEKPGLTSEKTLFGSVTEGPDTPYPPLNRGYGPDESAPSAFDDGQPTYTAEEVQALTQPSPEHKQSAAEKRAAVRVAKISQAAGEVYRLPVAVTRTGHLDALSPEDAYAVLRHTLIGTGGALTVDVETAGYPVGHQNYALRTVQLGGPQVAVVFDAAEPDHQAVIRQLLADAIRLHAHSAVADLVPLTLAGLVDWASAWERMADTVVAAKLADPQSSGSDPGLKQLSDAVLGSDAVTPTANAARAELFKAAKWLTEVKPDTPLERSGWAQVDSRCATMLRYAASDVLDTAELARRLPWPDEARLRREMATEAVTARISLHGLPLDAGHVAETRRRLVAELEPIRGHLGELGVPEPGSNVKTAERLVQLGATLPTTKGGALSVDKDALTALRGVQGPVGVLATTLLDWRKRTKLISAFLDHYAELCEHGDGRVRPTIYTLEADTGRMSSVRPNLQQLPREGGIRRCVTAHPGHLLISADFQGVELRVAAALSGDPDLLRFILDEDAGLNDGIHWAIAREVFGPSATKADRYMVKRGVFGHIYGGGIDTLARQVGVAASVMGRAIEVLKAMTPRLAAWSEEIRRAVRGGATEFRTYSGRVVYLDRELPHKAPNFCIQGTARELLVDALLRWAASEFGECVVLPVHDEIVASVPEADADRALSVLVECMATQLYGVPILPDPGKTAFAWQDAA